MVRVTSKSMASLSGGSSARVVRILGEGSDAKRLADLGFVSGVMVEMLRPGATCIVRLKKQRIGMGLTYQDSIVLE